MNSVTILGLIAGIFTSFSLLPQLIKALRTKHTRDLSLSMFSILATGIFLWILYGIILHDIAIIIANAVSFFFTFTILMLILKYKN
ncbi:SemiSWEET transporter [Candidatus Peregrinibacteria bacterium]|nr:SemiSWEET transporter [Candidatus Peregrinibacteria bacterium]